MRSGLNGLFHPIMKHKLHGFVDRGSEMWLYRVLKPLHKTYAITVAPPKSQAVISMSLPHTKCKNVLSYATSFSC